MKFTPLALVAALALSACTQTGEQISYGNDMLPPGGPAPGPTISYGNDALPSAEMTAFQTLNARLGYRDARIGYDARDCAIYQATGPDGRPYQELLRNPDNTTICRP